MYYLSAGFLIFDRAVPVAFEARNGECWNMQPVVARSFSRPPLDILESLGADVANDNVKLQVREPASSW